MGKKAVKQYFTIVIFVITVLLFIFTLIGLYGGNVTPAGHTMRAMLTLALPLLIILNVLALIYWACRRSLFFLIPVASIICSFKYIGTVFQFVGAPDNVKADFTLATYNVRRFNEDHSGITAMEVQKVLAKQGSDIICMQEFNNAAGGENGSVLEHFRDTYPYSAKARGLAIVSRYEILNSQEMLFEESNNGAMWADIRIDDSHTIRVFNVHMETTGINNTLSQANKDGQLSKESDIKDIAKNDEVRNNLLNNYIMRGIVRAGQAIQVANAVHDSPHPVVLCGDFNDVPYSFTYNTLLGNMKDGFRDGGHGYASTYKGAKGLFRIDYIFNNESMLSKDYYTINLDYSDHNPVISKIVFEKKK